MFKCPVWWCSKEYKGLRHFAYHLKRVHPELWACIPLRRTRNYKLNGMTKKCGKRFIDYLPKIEGLAKKLYGC